MIILFWQHNTTIQRHDMEKAQLIMIKRRHNLTIQRHNMEQEQRIMT